MADKSSSLQHVWWIETNNAFGIYNPRLAIAKTTVTDNESSFTYATAGETVRIYGAVYDEAFVASESPSLGGGIGMNDSPNIPSEYQEALVHYAVMKGYESKMGKEPDAMQKSLYFKKYWDECIRMGKQGTNKDFLDNASYVITPSDAFLM